MNDDDIRRRIHEALDGVHRPDPDLARRAGEAASRARSGRRLRAALSVITVAALAAGVLAVALVRHNASRDNQGPVATPIPTLTSARLVYALTAANQLVAVDRGTRHVRWTVQAAPPPSGAVRPGAMLQLSNDGSQIYVLPPTGPLGGNTLYVLDASSGHAVDNVALAAPGGALYRTLAVHPKTDDVFVVGQDSGHIVITVVDPSRRLILSTIDTRTLPARILPFQEYPYWATLTPDGSRLYYSFGPADSEATGIDWADVSGAVVRPCRPASSSMACLPGPGQGFALDGTHLMYPDFAASPNVQEVTVDGRKVLSVPSGLLGGVSDIVLDRLHNRLLLLAPCPNGGGLVGVDRASSQRQLFSTPGPAGGEVSAQTPCGIRPALLPDGNLVASAIAGGSASSEVPGSLVFIDANTGRVVGSVTLPAEAADVLAAGS